MTLPPPDTSPRERSSRSPLLVAGVVLAVLLAGAAIVIALMNRADPGDPAAAPSPRASVSPDADDEQGDETPPDDGADDDAPGNTASPTAPPAGDSTLIVLTPATPLEPPLVEATATFLEDRLGTLGVEGTARADGETIRLDLPEPPGSELLAELLAPSPLEMRSVLLAQPGMAFPPPEDTGDPDRPAEPAHPSDVDYYVTSQVRRDLAAIECAAGEDPAPAAPDQVLLTCAGPRGAGGEKFALSPAEILGDHVAGADVSDASLMLRLDDDGTARLAAMTSRIMSLPGPQNRLTVVVDGWVIISPTVADALEDGVVYLHGGDDEGDAFVVLVGFGRGDMVWTAG